MPSLPLRICPWLIAACLLEAAPVEAAPATPVLTATARFVTTGRWDYGSLDGHIPGRGTIWSQSPDAEAAWFPAVQSVCPVRISFFVVAHEGNASDAQVIVHAGGKADEHTIDLSTPPSRWVALGTYAFRGRGEESVVLRRGTRAKLRASAIRLEILDPKDTNMVWQTLILDEVIPYDSTQFAASRVEFTDTTNHPAADDIARLAAQGVLRGLDTDRFGPERAMSAADWFGALLRLHGETNVPTGAGLWDAARRRGWLTAGPAAPANPTARTALESLLRAARAARKDAWIKPAPALSDPTAWAVALGLLSGSADPLARTPGPLTHGQAAQWLGRYQRQVLSAGPPGDGWELAFHDEFHGNSLNAGVWSTAHRQTWGKLLSIRMKENIEVRDGLLRLHTRRENVAGKEWTTAMTGTGRAFRQKFGYWEACYRYAPAPGLNNAFWTNPGEKDKSRGFEIDFNEGHWPNTINLSLHQAGHGSLSKAWRAPEDLSRGFHIYGALWTEQEIVFYWDGREIDRKPNTKAVLESPVIFSTAVFPWAGPITDRLDGTSMDVDWVRVWRRTDGR